MPNPDVLVDVSELVRDPLRTGIQRVERELIRHWPGPSRLLPCIVDVAADRLRRLPEAAAALLTASREESQLDVTGEAAELRRILEREAPVHLAVDAGPVLNPELFFSTDRAAFYRRLVAGGREDVFWLIYDFLPYLETRWFEQGTSRHAMPYVWALRSVPRVAFISERTRQDYRHRVMRNASRDGPVITLGGDGLGLARQHFVPERRGFVVLGSIEPRKRVAAVLRAFATLWEEGLEVPLTVIGRLLPHAVEEIALTETLRNQPLLRVLSDASDAVVRETMEGARALIFASEGEGFGLPPFEALSCGIPVVAGPGLPSIEMLPPAGQIRLPCASVEAIADAVRRLQDDGVAARLWQDAASLLIPTWRSFAAATAAWIQGSG